MKLPVISGEPKNRGKEYGCLFSRKVQKNLSILVWRKGYKPLPKGNPDFISWIRSQEDIIKNKWPWLIDEMQGVAEGAGVQYEDILFLNLRVWQYDYYGGRCENCSSLVITLEDGTLACAGALDDVTDYYSGPVKVFPDQGYSFITFPIIGTSWGNRGMNSAGLSLQESSQILPGLRSLPNVINQDVAIRVILQTCATVVEVRKFCNEHPFTVNLLCVDKAGNMFCAHQTAAGLYELSLETPCVLTNHIVDDCVKYRLHQKGVREFPESSTTHLRRGNLLAFGRMYEGQCTANNVRTFIANTKNNVPESICPSHNVALTYANPQREGAVIWIAQPRIEGHEKWEKYQV